MLATKLFVSGMYLTRQGQQRYVSLLPHYCYYYTISKLSHGCCHQTFVICLLYYKYRYILLLSRNNRNNTGPLGEPNGLNVHQALRWLTDYIQLVTRAKTFLRPILHLRWRSAFPWADLALPHLNTEYLCCVIALTPKQLIHYHGWLKTGD